METAGVAPVAPGSLVSFLSLASFARWAALLVVALSTGCAAGVPLLHPARTLAKGDVRVAGGAGANVVLGSASDELKKARALGAADPNGVGIGQDPTYAKGVLVAAMEPAGVHPFVSGRVGIGWQAEGGLSYTGRAMRVDMRRSFDFGPWSLSLGAGGTAVLYARETNETLPGLSLSQLRGYGADVPVLVGWSAEDESLLVWAGPRGGFEHNRIELLTSEPKDVPLGLPPVGLAATRYFAGGLFGVALGRGRLHVSLEVETTHHWITGRFNGVQADVRGFTVQPASALWWRF